MDDETTRRRLLRAAATGGAAGLVGCLGGDGEAADPTASATASQSPTETPAGSEPASTATPTPDSTATGTPVHRDYETTGVVVETPEGEALGSVRAAVADTPDLRYTGLSDTESLPEDRGMLFVYDAPQGTLTYVMREMSFGIDIVFADPDGTINTIHSAPAPGPDEDGESQRYPGGGQYVLEVNYDWTTERGVEVGNVLRFDL